MSRRACHILFAVLCLFTIAPDAFSAEWVVGPLPGGPSLATILNDPALADGDIVRIPSGTYDYTGWSTLTVTKRIALVGDGSGISVITTTSSPVDFLRFKNDFSVRGFTIEGFDEALLVSAAAASDRVTAEIRDLEVRNSTVGVGWDGSTGGIRSLVIEGSRFHDLGGPAIRVEAEIIEWARVTGNDIEDVVAKGISLGADVPPPAVSPTTPGTTNPPDRGWHYVVTGNHVKNVHAADPGNPNTSLAGIILYGEEAMVSNNVVRDVRGSNENGRDKYPGIFTKCRRSIITGNVLRDVGPGYAIDVKGDQRGGTTAAHGYSVLIADNQVVVDPAIAGTNQNWNGIKTDNEDTSIRGNHVEVTGSAIFVQNNALNDINIIGNMIFGGWRGIDVRATTTDSVGTTRYVLIAHNHIVGVSLPAAIVHNNLTYPSGGIAGWVVGPNIIR